MSDQNIIALLAAHPHERCGGTGRVEVPTDRIDLVEPCDCAETPTPGLYPWFVARSVSCSRTRSLTRSRYRSAALCQSCHLQIQGRVDFEQQYMLEHSDWMVPFVEGFKAERGIA